jgi:serine protease AprX
MQKLLLVLICISTVGYSQNRFIVKLSDKGNSSYSLSSPLNFLSQRALNRRANQSIVLDSTDLPVTPNYVQQIAAINGVNILNYSKWHNTVTVEVASPSLLNSINTLPFVVSTSNVGRQNNTSISNSNKFELPATVKGISPALRTASFNYGNGQNQVQMININVLHDLGYTGQGMIIAVIDAGFQDADLMQCFDSLFLQNRILATWDFVDHETNVYNDYWHGTSVLSTMASNIEGDLVGTAPDAQYILLRSEDANTEYIIEEYNWASAAEFADSAGADVINSSLGYTEFDDPSQNHTYADMDGNTAPATIAADMAASKGILVVNSAGNEGNSAWQHIGAPADGDSVLAIGAVDASGLYASFSSQGPSFDNRIKPDVAAQGSGTAVYIPGITPSTFGSGTSFSGPVIAGAVTCLYQRFPFKKNVEIMNAVRQSASQFNNPDQFLGYGIPDFNLASFALGGYEITGKNEDLQIVDCYPNPASSGQYIKFTIFSKNKSLIDLNVINSSGQIIQSETLDGKYSYVSTELNSKLAAGIYIIRVTDDETADFVKLAVY